MTEIAIVLAALYLRGAPRPQPLPRAGGWRGVRELRRANASIQNAAHVLRCAGLWAESLAIDTPGLLAWAEERVLGGQVLTAVDDDYPCRWVEQVGPLALWRKGAAIPCAEVAVIGSRHAPAEGLRFCRDVGELVASKGSGLWSGGAAGCDRAAAAGAQGSAAALLAMGSAHAAELPGALLSLAPPDEPFSTALAMERNSLLASVSPRLVIGHARFGEGGTWRTATDALRRKRAKVLVYDDGSPGARALKALGAVAVRSPQEIFRAHPLPQPTLFPQAG